MSTSRVIVPDWHAFVAWAKDAGYDESYMDMADSKCLELQWRFVDECSDPRRRPVRPGGAE